MTENVTPTSLISTSSHRVYSISTMKVKGKTIFTDNYLRVTDFALRSDHWKLKLPCSRCISSVSSSNILYDPEEGIIYNLLNTDFETYFFTLDETNGDVKSKYLWEDYKQGVKTYNIQKQDSLIYLVFGCEKYTSISIYNTIKHDFIISYTGIKIQTLAFTPYHAFIAYSDDPAQPIVELVRGPKDSFNIFYDFKIDYKGFVEPTQSHNYTIEHDIRDIYVQAKSTFRVITDLERNKVMKVDTVEKIISDFEFFLEPNDLGFFLNSNQHNSTYTMLCSKIGTDVINYSIRNWGDHPLPEWVTTAGEGKIILDAPYVPEDTQFYFTLNAEIADQNRVFSKPVSLTVKR
mmetsp:Transcript_24504/g.21747  ORF Transcript_24504/g.21747 Transcript_24504/m.21747 type:complete len:347 (+) Transcript_24504:521-1561(+)